MNGRLLEILGQLLVGDAVTCLLVPRPHMLLWRDAFQARFWRDGVQWFADHPRTTAAVGLLEGAIGIGCIIRASRRP